MIITKEIKDALKKGKDRIKRTESNFVPKEFWADSAWLEAVNNIIDRTTLAIQDELENIK